MHTCNITSLKVVPTVLKMLAEPVVPEIILSMFGSGLASVGDMVSFKECINAGLCMNIAG